MKTGDSQRAPIWVYLLLIVIAAAPYVNTLGFEFLSYDDSEYVTANPRVQQGLTWSNVAWAFTTTSVSNWHPLTWLSYMLDYELSGGRPGWFHFTNVFFHVANTLLLLIVLRRMTGAVWRSALVAALFAVHPMHVESVAWIAERKDVLSTFFGLACVAAYARYASAPSIGRYVPVALLFALSLLCKPMLVTLPFVFLLLDYWPLRRLAPKRDGAESQVAIASPRITRLLAEKIPLLVMSIAISAATVRVQESGGAMFSLILLPFGARVVNAIVAYVSYLGLAIWPTGMAVLYPHPGEWPVHIVVLCVSLLIAVTAVAIALRNTQRHLIVGWLWFLGTLVPVIGLVQVGFQSMADRYTYVPFIGVFIMAAWSLPGSGAEKFGRWAGVSTALALAALMAFGVGSWIQVQYWSDSETLYRRALSVTEKNFIIHYNLGILLHAKDRNDEVIEQFTRCLEIQEDYAPAQDNLGNALAAKGEYEKAIAHYKRAIELVPDAAATYNNLGSVYAQMGRLEEAVQAYVKSLELDPKSIRVQLNLGETLLYLRKYQESYDAYAKALTLDEKSAAAHVGMGRALAVLNRVEESLGQFDEALRLDPANTDAAFYRERVEGAWKRMNAP